MKYAASLIVLTLSAVKCHAQLEDRALDSLKKLWTEELMIQIEDQAIGMSRVEEGWGWSDFANEVANGYAKDTFLLNGILENQLDADQTTFGMVRALDDYENGYDALLNRYYRLLLEHLEKPEQDLLRESQRNWIKERDSERQLSAALTKEEYSGGGTIQQLNYAGWNATYTKHRVDELIDYLTRLQE